MSNKVVTTVQASAGGIMAGSGFYTWIEQNATLITLGFTALTFVVYCAATLYKLRMEKKAMGL